MVFVVWTARRTCSSSKGNKVKGGEKAHYNSKDIVNNIVEIHMKISLIILIIVINLFKKSSKGLIGCSY